MGCFEACQTQVTSSPESLSTSLNNDHSSILSLAESKTNLIYCAIGCNHAPTVYLEQVRRLIGEPPKPRATLGTITKDSLVLEWPKELSKLLPSLKQRVQYKYANISSTWSYLVGSEVYQDASLSKVKISNLVSYTSYLYRIEWQLIPWLGASIWSPTSEPIRTLEYGNPSTACSITSALSISSSQISIDWSPPSFANGPIISYGIYLNDLVSNETLAKDYQMHSQTSQNQPSSSMNYVFNGLKPSRRYRISIATLNNFGYGPACEREIETGAPKQSLNSESKSNEDDLLDEKNSFFVASTTAVEKRDRKDIIMYGDSIFFLHDFNEKATITGMAFHAMKKLLFVADSSGVIRQVSLKESSNVAQKIIPSSSIAATHLSIDWLNDKLYYSEENRFLRCDLNGDSLESIVTGFKERPIDMKVDPYNGYLFWLLKDPGTNGVLLYRIDLAKLSQHNNRKLAYTNGHVIYKAVGLSTFAINYFDYRIYFPETSKEGTEIFSITIDGKDPEKVRGKRDSTYSEDHFANMQNLIVNDNKIFFTRKESIFWEEYHEKEDKYYDAVFNSSSDLVAMLAGDGEQSQPTPIPLNPVRNVEAIFLDRSTKISWTKPELYGGAGDGAWQYWNYSVGIREFVQSDNEHLSEHFFEVSNQTHCLAEELKPDTEYAIRVRAVSSAGHGAWSDVFVGRTLPTLNTDYDQPYALVASRDVLLKTDIVGKFLHELVPRNKLNKLSITGNIFCQFFCFMSF